MVSHRAAALRAALHLAVWLPFVSGAMDAARSGWLPISDDAAIALRSWDALTSYGPLVGQASRLAFGVFDPGPLEYWLLSLPVRIDPVHGAFWGAALWCAIACSLTVEAAWSAAGLAGGVLATASLIAALAWIPDISHNPLWNPWFGLMFCYAAFAAGWAVLAGRRPWWPMFVITASVAAQAHLMYALACAALVLTALAAEFVGIVRRRVRPWWPAAAVAAGLACWIGPLIQQFGGPNGNLSALVHGAGPGRTGGIGFGLRAVAASVRPPPLWWTPFHAIEGLWQVSQWPPSAGVAALVIVTAIGLCFAMPWALRSRVTAALAGVSLVTAVATVVTFAALPAADIAQIGTADNSITYLLAPMLPVGILAWLTVGAGAALLGWRLAGLTAAAIRAVVRRGWPAGQQGWWPAPARAGLARFAAAVSATGSAGLARMVRAPGTAGTGRTPGVRAVPGTGAAGLTSAEFTALGGLTPGVASRRPASARAATGFWPALAAAAAIAGVLVLGWVESADEAQAATRGADAAITSDVKSISRLIEKKLPVEPVAVTVSGLDQHYRRGITLGVAYALVTIGYRPEVAQNYSWQLGPAYVFGDQNIPQVVVSLGLNKLSVAIGDGPHRGPATCQPSSGLLPGQFAMCSWLATTRRLVTDSMRMAA